MLATCGSATFSALDTLRTQATDEAARDAIALLLAECEPDPHTPRPIHALFIHNRAPRIRTSKASCCASPAPPTSHDARPALAVMMTRLESEPSPTLITLWGPDRLHRPGGLYRPLRTPRHLALYPRSIPPTISAPSEGQSTQELAILTRLFDRTLWRPMTDTRYLEPTLTMAPTNALLTLPPESAARARARS